MKTITKFLGLISTIRPITCLFSLIIYSFGIFLSSSNLNSFNNIVLNGITIAVIVAFGNSINDYFDYHSDLDSSVKKYYRNGKVTKPELLIFTLALLTIAVTLTLLIPDYLLKVFSFSCISLSFLYSFLLKSIPLIGNISVAILSGSVVPYAGLVTNGLSMKCLAIGILMGLFSLQYEILASVRDSKSDFNAGIKNISHYMGVRQTIGFSFVIFIGFSLGNLSMFFLNYFSKMYFFLFLGLNFLPLFITYFKAFNLGLDEICNYIMIRFNLVWYLSILILFFIK